MKTKSSTQAGRPHPIQTLKLISTGASGDGGAAERGWGTLAAGHFVRAFFCLLFLTLTPGAQTQYVGVPQAPGLVGPTLGASLRNAAAATHTYAESVRRGANDWGRRANSGLYRAEQFQADFTNMQLQYQALRQQFNGLASLALQLGSPRANNSVAELDAGLNIIAELLTFLQGQFNAGTLDQRTIVRTCRALEDAMREWDRELKKSSSRIGLVG